MARRLGAQLARGVSVAPRVIARVERALDRAAIQLGLEPAARAALGVRLVDDREIASLRWRFMRERGVTDVLAFPAGAGAGSPGDLAISVPQAARQAPDHLELELIRLGVHALCHLVGHDHATRRQGRAMHRVERRILARLGVPDAPRPYGIGAPRR